MNGLQEDLNEDSMDGRISRDHGFEKEKDQIYCLYTKFNLGELDDFKVVMDGCLWSKSILRWTKT